jgi:hypothetical protein
VKTIQVEIKGITPLLVHRFGEEAEAGKQSRPAMVADANPRETARKVAYIAEDGTFYFSAFSIPNAMGSAGSNHKMKGTRKTARFVVPSAIRMTSDTITILNCDDPAKDFEVDARPVTIPSTKGRVMRYRPRFNEWGAKFDMVVNETLMTVELAHRLLEEAGQQIGVGDFRPEKRGPFGTFRVVNFKEIQPLPRAAHPHRRADRRQLRRRRWRIARHRVGARALPGHRGQPRPGSDRDARREPPGDAALLRGRLEGGPEGCVRRAQGRARVVLPRLQALLEGEGREAGRQEHPRPGVGRDAGGRRP